MTTRVHPPPSSDHSNTAGPSRLSSPTQHLPTRLQSNDMPPPSSTLPSRKRKLAPTQPTASPIPSSPSVSETSGDARDAEYEPVSHPPARAASKRTKAATGGSTSQPAVARGGSATSSTGRGMSREALRKANHSLIERRRREKINFALGELRDMVPGLGDAEGGKGGEFKLEVLERTVIHMKELKAHIAELEARPLKSPTNSTSSSGASSSRVKSKSSASSATSKRPSPPVASKPILSALPSPAPLRRSTESPPTPSQSPDPNETDAEPNLPPAFTVASRPQLPDVWSNHSSPTATPSITSLLASVPDRTHPQPTSRPSASSHAYNPTLYLPFPTPSPTSPFLSYSHASSASSGPPEPSPFLAPMQGMALFGGALTLDKDILASSPADALVAHNPAGMGGQGKDGRTLSKEQEDAANVLLAFSSPDVMRPVGYMTPIVVPAESGGRMDRRGTLDSEEFVLDGGVISRSEGGARKGGPPGEIRGKTARDILRM